MAHIESPHRILAAVVVACGALAAHGPAPLNAQGPTFKGGVAMVPLTVTVTDTTGRHVTGLTSNDFKVFEDGVEQPLSFFACDEVPVDVALVVDASGSMRADWPLVQAAAIGLVGTLRASDRGAVIAVRDNAAIPQPFTSDRALIERAIRGLSMSGSTALYDGLYIALKEFERERRAALQVKRQALVLLSDGLDNRSRLAFDDVLDLARRVDVSIYVVALRGDTVLVPRAMRDRSMLQAEYTMGAVARESGGRTFFPKSARELPAIYTTIAEELASQYELGYMPARPGGDGSFRRVAVKVPPQTNGQARTRTGYYASRTKLGP